MSERKVSQVLETYASYDLRDKVSEAIQKGWLVVAMTTDPGSLQRIHVIYDTSGQFDV